MKPQDEKYIHGTAPEEQERLSRLNEILNERSLHGLNIRLGERVLDVGCGLSQLTRGMARKAGSEGVVIGIEENAEQIAEGEYICVKRTPRRANESRFGVRMSLVP